MKEKDIIFRVAVDGDATLIHGLMEEVYNRLEDKSIYVCDDLDYVKEHISNQGFVVVACNKDEEIVGSFIVRYPYQDEDNLEKDIDLPNNKLDEVVHMESSVVLPEYRGNGLQSKLLLYAERLIDKTKYHYFMATVSPENPASYKNLEKNKYKLVLTKEKYGGLIRRIYLKEV